MGYIRIQGTIDGLVSSGAIRMLFDTGARRNFIRQRLDSLQNVFSIGISAYRGEITASLANRAPITGKNIEFPRLNILGASLEPAPFVVLEDLAEEAIIGALTMQRLGVVLRPSAHSASIEA